MKTGLIATLLFVLAPAAVAAQAGPTGPAGPLYAVLHADQGTTTISRQIYGQFAEHLGRGIYDGIWTRTGTGQWHLRQDVVAALRKIQVPNVRWPGGCFADNYHWQDGIGPRDKRPTIVNTNWGNVTEDNSFGTHEYMEFIRAVGADPFIVGNVGSGTVREMADWWNYLNFPGTSPMADLRRQNGREQPYNVRYWGIGNEPWGCGGNMSADYYADVYKRYATYLAPFDSVRPFRVAGGPSGGDTLWTEVLMRKAGRFIDGIDMHYYTIANNWSHKGSATDFTEREWFSALQQAGRVDELINQQEAVLDRFDPRKRVALIVGEWGIWHDVEPGTNPGFLYQQNTLRDALVASLSLDIFNRHADRVRGANIAQMVNVLQAMILTRGDQMILTPTYHVFEMYTVHHDATLLPLTFAGAAEYHFGGDSIPAVSASASRDKQGRIHLTLSNLDPRQAHTLTTRIEGATATDVSGRILTANAMNAHNTFEHPDVVRPAPFGGARVTGGSLKVTMPPMSIVVLELR